MRLIDADILREFFKKDDWLGDVIRAIIDAMPTATMPNVQWCDGIPTEPGLYCCIIDFQDGDKPSKTVLKFDGTDFYYDNADCHFYCSEFIVKHVKLPEV